MSFDHNLFLKRTAIGRYEVVCDETNNGPENVAARELIATIRIIPDDRRTDFVFDEQGKFIRTEYYAKFNGNWFEVNDDNTVGQHVEFVGDDD